jgi:hypothetical protein
MAGKVFISCGQATNAERAVGNSLFEWFKEKGFDPYLAVDVPTLFDLNNQILKDLANSDFFLFVNFKRETGATGFNLPLSLFSHQELAIAYSLGFERVIIVNQKGALKEGILKFIVSNTPEFEEKAEVLGIVKKVVETAKWNKEFSRGLFANNLVWGDVNPRMLYRDHSLPQPMCQVTLFCDIVNNRFNQGAGDCIARLAFIKKEGDERKPSWDRSHLKVTGQSGYKQNIFPASHGAFDLLSINYHNPDWACLHSALDTAPRQPIIQGPGKFELDYEVFAENFPLLRFRVKIELNGTTNPIPPIELGGGWTT